MKVSISFYRRLHLNAKQSLISSLSDNPMNQILITVAYRDIVRFSMRGHHSSAIDVKREIFCDMSTFLAVIIGQSRVLLYTFLPLLRIAIYVHIFAI